ncbi:uncharacterized protein LOC143028903 [Oratosquilla oratoria]|uniref:uncharacterized protein LOC143028903 n=1 Tax=Oratosquilla oratoria TaxID=337810 RepID=UPI003F75827F
MFTKKSANKTKIRWECSQRSALSCKGSAHTDIQMKEIVATTPHSHDSYPAHVAATKVKAAIKDTTTANRCRLGQIVADALVHQPVEMRAAIGRIASVKRSVRRLQKECVPKDPASLQELRIEGEWKTTGPPDNISFLVYDNVSSSNRIIVYATYEGLKHLCRNSTWFMDDTFSTAPRLFHQLYVIRVPLGNKAITCVYAFLSGKYQASYEEFLQVILDKCDQLGFNPDVTTIITDFEQAMINAVQTVLGTHVTSRGCFYHLTQSIWRKIQSLGLVNAYRTDDRVKHFCGMLNALAFLPEEEITTGMEYLMENIPDVEGLDSLVDYFNATYVSGSFRRIQPPAQPDRDLPPVLMRRISPLFPPRFWNVHQVTLYGKDRTNNLCEAWNFGFKELVGYDHPTIWKAIDSIRKDQALTTAALLRDSTGEPPRKRVKRATKARQERVRNLCVDFVSSRKTVEEFLYGVGHSMSWK